MKIKADLIHNPDRMRPAWCQVEKVVELSGPDFDKFLIAPQEEQPFIANAAELMHQWDGVNYCLLVLAEGRADGVLIDSEGSSRARYAAYLPQARTIVNAKLDQVVNFIVKQGVRNTETGDWCICHEELKERFDLSVSDGSGLDAMLKEKLECRPEVSAVDMSNGAIETTFRPEVCRKLQSRTAAEKQGVYLKDILPLLAAPGLDTDPEEPCNSFITHPETDACVWSEDLRELTPTGRENFAALLNAWVAKIIPTGEGIEVVLTDVDPEELVRFNEACEAFQKAEQAMGDMTP